MNFKKLFLSFSLFAFLVSLSWNLNVFAVSVDLENTYKSIVKINTFIKNEKGELQHQKSGSGVIIRSDGLILTSKNLVISKDKFGNDIEVALNICLTLQKDKAPQCEFIADIISIENNLGVALLKLQSHSSLNDLYKLNIAQTTNGLTHWDRLKGFGYDNISYNSTITEVMGNFNSRIVLEKSAQLKTDLQLADGMAIISAFNELVGISINQKNEFLNDNFAIIDIEFINTWLKDVINTEPKLLQLNNNLKEFLAKREKAVFGKSLNELFENKNPNFTITRPTNYSYVYNDETSLKLVNKNTDGGYINIDWIRYGVLAKLKFDDHINLMRFNESCWQDFGDVTIDGIKGKHLFCKKDNVETNKYIIPVKNDIVTFTFSYGKNYRDWDTIRYIFNKGIVFEKSNNIFSNVIDYNTPKFKINVLENSNWGLVTKNSYTNPLSGHNDKMDFNVYYDIIHSSKISLSNENYYKAIMDNDFVKLELEKSFKPVTIYDSWMDFKINDKINNAIRYSYKAMKDNENRYFVSVYHIRNNNEVYIITYSYLGWDEGVFVKERENFEKNILANLSINFSNQVDPIIEKKDDKIYIDEKKELVGSLIKGVNHKAVYLLRDGKRYVFPNEKVYYSWYSDFSKVNTIADTDLAKYPIGKNITFRPGTLMKIPSIDKVFVVEFDNKISWIQNEELAKNIYGTDWKNKVKDLGASFFMNYEEIIGYILIPKK